MMREVHIRGPAMAFTAPQPLPEHRRLEAMCGTFTGEEIQFASAWGPEERRRTSTLHAKMLDGFFVVSDYVQSEGSTVNFRGHGVYGYDAENACYRMHWFDSMGGPGSVVDGQFEGDVLTFEKATPHGHNRYRYTFKDDGYVFEIALSQDGVAWQPLMQATFTRTE
ncbi:MAG: DUF1579 family protein [Planctomycetes bacterium]|nr:DUF1579 family protein [Planctomycetota bacterium]